eukprot:2195465-Rhodomonas_salina.2
MAAFGAHTLMLKATRLDAPIGTKRPMQPLTGRCTTSTAAHRTWHKKASEKREDISERDLLSRQQGYLRASAINDNPRLLSLPRPHASLDGVFVEADLRGVEFGKLNSGFRYSKKQIIWQTFVVNAVT